MLNIKARQGIKYLERNSKTKRNVDRVYGLVIVSDDDYIGVIPVGHLYNKSGVRKCYCYDEPEAQLTNKYQHNILLKNSPKPFTEFNNIISINGQVIHNTFVKADKDLIERIAVQNFDERCVELVDDGVEISDDEWHEICNHMDMAQIQKEFVHKSTHLNSRKLPFDAEPANNTKSNGMEF